MEYIPDAYEQWEQHEAEQEAAIERLPRCSECDEHIQSDYAYEVNGEYICEACMEEHRVSVETIGRW